MINFSTLRWNEATYLPEKERFEKNKEKSSESIDNNKLNRKDNDTNEIQLDKDNESKNN